MLIAVIFLSLDVLRLESNQTIKKVQHDVQATASQLDYVWNKRGQTDMFILR